MPDARAVIFANGLLPDLEAAGRLIEPGEALIAADGGTRHALALGRVPGVVIGDLDSLLPADRLQLDAAGARLIVHPRDKNETDLELALRYAVENGFRTIVVVGALGGRLDQTLGNLALLTTPTLAGLDVCLDDGIEQVRFTRDRLEVQGKAGDLVSLLPWGADAGGVTTQGLRWPLSGETLSAHGSRGISNELLGETASVTLESGLLLVVQRRNRQPTIVNRRSLP
jgi:thiamine pyrophosphokinase